MGGEPGPNLVKYFPHGKFPHPSIPWLLKTVGGAGQGVPPTQLSGGGGRETHLLKVNLGSKSIRRKFVPKMEGNPFSGGRDPLGLTPPGDPPRSNLKKIPDPPPPASVDSWDALSHFRAKKLIINCHFPGEHKV